MAKEKKPRGVPFQKGKSGNPKGLEPVKIDTLILRKHTRNDIMEAICKVMTDKVFDTEILAENPYAPGAQALMASVMVKAIELGCHQRAQFFMSYMFGRPTEYDPKDDTPPPAYKSKMDSVPSHAIIKAMKEAQANAEPIAP